MATELSNKIDASFAAPRTSGQNVAGSGSGLQNVPDVRQNLPSDKQAVSSVENSAPVQPDAQDLAKAVNELNSRIQTVQRDLEFSVDEDLGKTIITVTDTETQEVIRQIPAEEMLALARFFKEMGSAEEALAGLLFEKQA